MDLNNRCIINLPHRVDRLEHIQREIRYLFDGGYTIVPGHTDEPSSLLNIAKAHLSCIRMAKANKWTSVLIIEDDCVFQGKEKTRGYVAQAMRRVPEDWNILLGGLYHSNHLEPVNEYWNKTDAFCGAHFYIVNSNCYEKLLNYDNEHHFDRFINLKNDLNCYVTRKMFATQLNGYSDNAKTRVDYTRQLKKFELL